MAASSGVPLSSPRYPHHHNESISLRSFRVTAPYALASSAVSTASAPSLKAASLKVRGARAFAHLLGSRGRPAFPPPPDEPRLADLTDPSDFPSKSSPSKMPQPPKNSTPPQHPSPLSPTAAAQAPQAMRTNSKSRTIIRMLTTKFTPRSSPSSAAPAANLRRGPTIPAAPSAFNAERRAAALRERGLLPPLPARDLSTLEMEQDQRLPIVSPIGDGPGGDDEAVSAADLIKRDWEAKNNAINAPSTSGASEAGDGNGDAPIAATTLTPVLDHTDTRPVDAEALNRERMRGFRFGGGTTPPNPNSGLESQYQQLDQHQEDCTDIDKAESTEISADSSAKEHAGDTMPRPLPVPPHPPRAPSPVSSSPTAPAQPPLSSSPVALSPLSAISTSTSQFASTAPLSPPPTDALPPLPPSPLQSSPSRSSTLSRPLPSPPTSPSPTQRQIHPDLQAFTFPPPSPGASAPAFVLNLSEAAARASVDSSLSSSTMDHPAPADMDAWAAALPPIPPSPAPSVRSTRSVVSLRSMRSVQGPRAPALPMPSSPPPPTPMSPSMAQMQGMGPPLSPSLVPLPSSPLPPAISLTPPVAAGTVHARDDSFALLEASMSFSGAATKGVTRSASTRKESGAGESGKASEGLRDNEAANGDRDLRFSSASASAPERATEAISSSPSSASTGLAPSSSANAPPSPTRVGIPKGKLGALTVQTRSAAASPVLVVVESPPATGGSMGSRWAEELAVVVEEHEGDLSGSGDRSRAGSVTPTPSLGAATTVGVGGTTPTSATATATTLITGVFETKSTANIEVSRRSEDSAASDPSNPTQYVYARPPGAAAPLVASPVSSSHSHSLSQASSSSSAAAGALSSAEGGVPPTPATFAARVPLPPTPTSPGMPLTPSIRVSSPTSPTAGKRGRTAQKRGATDPTAVNGAAATEKRKTFNPFKRSASALASSGGDGPTRRLSVAKSLSAHLRRSMTSASSNGNGNGTAARTFDASHLPPSPTPQRTGFATTAGANGGANGSKAVRQPVAPIVYTHGSISAAANAIEDEESRRMTEMAFLG